MKKLFTVSLLVLSLATVSSAKDWKPKDIHKHEYKQMMKTHPILNKYRIELQENKLALMKEMAKPNPNFKNVEKLNLEKYTIKSKLKTEKMKLKHEFKTKYYDVKTI